MEMWRALAARTCCCLLAVFGTAFILLPRYTTIQQQHKSLFGAHAIRSCSGQAGPEVCGRGWAEKYTRLHSDIVSGKRPPKFLVAECHSGIADSLKGIQTLLWLAILTDRALLIKYVDKPKRTTPHFEWGFTAPNVNWTCPRQLHAMAGKSFRKLRFDPGKDPHTGIPYRDTDPDILHMRHRNVRQLHAQSKVLRIWLNGDMSSLLFQNPHHQREIAEWGLQPEHAMKCALEFLFDIRPEVQQMFAAQLEVLRDPAALKVGIQIRTGDSVLLGRYTGHADMIRSYGAFFDCADQIAGFARQPHQQQVVWFLITDSVELRRQAAARFGERLLTNMEIPVGHVVLKGRFRPPDLDAARDRFLAAAGEMWLFTFTDYHVISLASGFGRVAAQWGGRDGVTYSLNPHRGTGPEGRMKNRSCGALDYDS